MKTYYSDYVIHCLKFRIRYPEGNFSNYIDKKKWMASDKIYNRLSNDEKFIISNLYSTDNGNLRNNIQDTATAMNCRESTIWNLLSRVEHDLAVELELIDKCVDNVGIVR